MTKIKIMGISKILEITGMLILILAAIYNYEILDLIKGPSSQDAAIEQKIDKIWQALAVRNENRPSFIEKNNQSFYNLKSREELSKLSNKFKLKHHWLVILGTILFIFSKMIDLVVIFKELAFSKAKETE